MLCIITDRWSGNEPDILTGHHLKPLKIILAVTCAELVAKAPPEGWTTDRLQETANRLLEGFKEPADAYLGEQWVGSTEV